MLQALQTQKSPVSCNSTAAASPQIKRPTARDIEPGVIPMAGQNIVIEGAPMQRKSEMRRPVVEREDFAAVAHD